MPLYERDHRHDDGTGWRGGAVLAVVMCIIAAGHAAANAASAQHSSGQTCSPGVRTIGGAVARVFCGPAKASAKVGSTAFAFAGGACLEAPRFTLNIGTLSFDQGAKASYFGISLPRAKAGTYKGSQVTLGFNAGQRRVSLASSAGARLVLAPGRHSGTFSGKDLVGNTVTGSFTC